MKSEYFTHLSLMIALLAAILATPAHAESNRMKRKAGAFAAVNQPNPGILGLNVAYHFADVLRADAGYASMSSSLGTSESSTSTLGFGINAYVPDWSLSPTVGLHFATVSYSGNNAIEVGGFTSNGSHLYASLGVDWQAESGFHAGLGYNLSFKSGIGGSGYVALGWFFDFLN